MPMLGNIVVGLTATTGRFSRDMKTATKSVKRFSQGVASAASRMARFGSVATLAAAGGVALLTRRSMQSIDATAKLADRIGETTQRLQGLRHAANITGAGSETMDKSLQKMQKTLGEAAAGIGQGRYALDAMGMSVDDLMGKSPAEQFAIISDRVKGLATAEERAFVATNLFGRSGQSLINTMMLGSKGLASMQAEADKLGISFSRVDAAKVEAANDALTRVGAVFEGLGNTLAINFAPYIESAAQKFVALAGSGEGMAKRVTGAFRWVAETIAAGADYLNLFSAGFYTVESGVKTLVAGFLNGFSMMKAAVFSLGGIFNNVFAGAVNGFSFVKGAAYGLAGAFGKAFGFVIEKIASSIARLEFELKKRWNAWKRITRQISEVEESRANTRARNGMADRIAQIQGAAGAMGKRADSNFDRAKAAFADGASGKAGAAFDKRGRLMQGAASDAFSAGLSGEAGAAWDSAAKKAAENAVSAYDRFTEGTAQKGVAGFFDSIQSGAQVAAEKVAANAAAMNQSAPTVEGAVAAAAGKSEGKVRGSFSAMSLVGAGSKVEKDQLDTQKRMNKNLEKLVRVAEEPTLAILG